MITPDNAQSDPRAVKDVFVELSESGPAVQRQQIQTRIADDQEAREDAKRRRAVTGALLALKGKPTAATAAEAAGPNIARLTERAARQPSLNFGGVGFSELVCDVSTDWLRWVEDSLQANVKGWRALLGCRSAAEVAAVQSRLIEDHLEILQHDRRGRAPAT